MEPEFINKLKNVDGVISNVDFSGMSLQKSTLKNVTFENCRFENACLDDSDLELCEFYNCNLTKASFRKVFMECGCFRECKCIETDFTKAHLMASVIIRSDWSGANVSSVNLIEVEASNWIINGMIIDKNTAIIDGKFCNVDWSEVDVSMLNISLEQVKWFLECTKGGKKLQVYEDYVLSSFEKRENAILKELWNEYEKDKLAVNQIQNTGEVLFISYASEQKKTAMAVYNMLKSKYHVWIDSKLKKDWKLRGQIESILVSCSVAVVFLTKEYSIKAWTRYEFGRLLEEMEKRDLKIYIISDIKNNQNLEEIAGKDCGKIIFVNVIEELLEYFT